VPRTRLLDTSTFRLTVLYVGLFSLSVLALLSMVYVLSVRFMDDQIEEAIREDVAGLHLYLQSPRIGTLQEVIQKRSEREPALKSIYSLVDLATGQLLAGHDLPSSIWRWSDANQLVRFQVPVEETAKSGKEMHHAVAQLVAIDGRFLLLVGRDIQDRLNTLGIIRISVAIGTGLMLVLGVVGGYVMSRWMLRRLDVINRTTSRIMAGDFSRRIEVSDTDDEFDELGRNVNLMLDRIDRLLAGMRQVTDDIAHDLRTPLSRLRSRIELGMMRDLSQEETRELLEATIRDADGLIETFNALLSIARAEAGSQRTEWEAIDLSEVVSEVFELYEPLAEENGIELTAETEPHVTTLGSRQLVAQAIANLTDNAIKYTPAGGRVWLRTRTRPAPQVEVADTGPGIPPDQREHAKARFVRLDATRGTPGSGLGLSLVDAVAKLHDARLELGDREPGGLKVLLTFQPSPSPMHERPIHTPDIPAGYAGSGLATDGPAS
jgi:signal transduction histidine kinase